MISVVIVGTGNVAQNLFQAFYKVPDIEIKQVLGRNEIHLAFAKEKVSINTDFSRIPTADIYILAVSDDSIGEVAEKFKDLDGLVVHTSGATSIEVLHKCNRAGIFYPLQTFTKGKIISFETIPICIETKNKKDLELLQNLGKTLSDTVIEINSEQRKILHVSAVFVNNFTNYLYTIGADICKESNIDFKLLQPLIKGALYLIK